MAAIPILPQAPVQCPPVNAEDLRRLDLVAAHLFKNLDNVAALDFRQRNIVERRLFNNVTLGRGDARRQVIHRQNVAAPHSRSEERRVGKECRSWWWTNACK